MGEQDSRESFEGHLMKKCRRTGRWKQVFAKVTTNSLTYGESDKLMKKQILLNGAVIKDLDEEEGKTNHFTVKPENVNRTFHFSTSNQDEHNNWLQALCMARMAGPGKSESSEACTIQ
eukprot:gene20122-22095_t